MESTGLTGIYWDDERLTFRVWIYSGNRSGRYVGDFETLTEAQAGQDRARREPLPEKQSANGEDLAEIRFQKLQAEADRETFTNSVPRGEYVRTEDVQAAMATRITELKNKLLGFPGMIAPLVIGQDKDEMFRIMTEYLEDLLKDLDKPLDPDMLLLRNRRLTKYQETAKGYENGQARRLQAKIRPGSGATHRSRTKTAKKTATT
jgi:hypothetical protein